MIESLHISNYALIENIDIVFDRGLNIITGETGAGKSIILGALGLVMGDRADMSARRDPEAKTVVEAVFDISGLEGINSYLEANDLDTGPGQVILRRERLDQLREVSVRLLDIHSQHQNLLLADPAFQLSVLDAVAGNEALLAKYREAYAAYRTALGKYRRTEDMLRRNRSEEEYLTFQLRQLDELGLKEGEQEQLEKEYPEVNEDFLPAPPRRCRSDKGVGRPGHRRPHRRHFGFRGADAGRCLAPAPRRCVFRGR